MIKKITLIAFALVAGIFASNAATFKAYVNIPDEDFEAEIIPWVYYWGIGEGGTECPSWPGLPLDPDKIIHRGSKTWFVYEFETGNEVEDKSGAKVGKIDGFIINDGGACQSKNFDENQVGQGWYIVTDWTDKDNGYQEVTDQYYTNRPDVVVNPEYQEEWIPADLPVYEGKTFAYCVDDVQGGKMNVWPWIEGVSSLYDDLGWPGLSLGEPVAKDTQGNDIYLWIKGEDLADPDHIIFSIGGNPQTADLEFANGGFYCITKHQGGRLVKVIEGGEPQPQYPEGDLNKDEKVNVGDVAFLYSALLAGKSDAELDLNKDGSVNAGDVGYLYKLILGSAE